MKFCALILVGCMMIGCGPDPTTPGLVPNAPKQTESALPEVKKIKTGVDDGVVNNTNVGIKLKEQSLTIKEQKESIDKALDLADELKRKLANKEEVFERDTFELISEIQKTKTRNMFLELQASDLTKLKDDQEKILKGIQDSLAIAQEKVINRDNETSILRDQQAFLSKNLTIKNKEVQDLAAAYAKEQKKSATAGVYRNWAIAAVVLLILGFIIKTAISLYSPLKI